MEVRSGTVEMNDQECSDTEQSEKVCNHVFNVPSACNLFSTADNIGGCPASLVMLNKNSIP